MAEKLKLAPNTTRTLKIKGFKASQTFNNTVVDLQPFDIENRETHKLRNVYIVDNDQIATSKEHVEQIGDKYGHLKNIQKATAQQHQRREPDNGLMLTTDQKIHQLTRKTNKYSI